MKKVFLIHGWGGGSKEPMHQWIKKKLEERGYEVLILEMPNSEKPEIHAWISRIKEVVNIDKETILIGHSIGCQAILRYLERLPKENKFRKIILIAPWMKLDEKTIEEEGEEGIEIAKPWMETPIDFDKVKKHSEKFYAIFSDNDPYVPIIEEKFFKKKLGAQTMILNSKGHFDSESGIKELPEILEFLK